MKFCELLKRIMLKFMSIMASALIACSISPCAEEGLATRDYTSVEVPELLPFTGLQLLKEIMEYCQCQNRHRLLTVGLAVQIFWRHDICNCSVPLAKYILRIEIDHM